MVENETVVVTVVAEYVNVVDPVVLDKSVTSQTG